MPDRSISIDTMTTIGKSYVLYITRWFSDDLEWP